MPEQELKPYERGKEAFEDGKSYDDNPYYQKRAARIPRTGGGMQRIESAKVKKPKKCFCEEVGGWGFICPECGKRKPKFPPHKESEAQNEQPRDETK